MGKVKDEKEVSIKILLILLHKLLFYNYKDKNATMEVD